MYIPKICSNPLQCIGRVGIIQLHLLHLLSSEELRRGFEERFKRRQIDFRGVGRSLSFALLFVCSLIKQRTYFGCKT